ncbi:NADPH:quinone reductase-like Zn-dependent oxidoreductase [Nocardioides marinisabuli]|uniref:NADPH:quinone reductase-like Zn-dependent oxidoreductase n=1 Tax=Nocardioides marinisabuli TaxID=419476 RepID=A0A7Y9JNN7_9ACTN|nr:NAD(P)-dependent alcohol dehydrogenase [Nocardioides marinisabuli]NYD56062.1 NADPH:quinone reductase-like Zn-dependent oxidoreductase [Nocardioides marinisabuli]
MRAITQHRYGGTETLQLTEIETPTPGPDEVLVRVRAAGVDRGTWHLMAGRPYAVRLAFGLRRPEFPVAGRDVAGVVDRVGADVTTFAIGDEVIGTADGSYADFAVVPVTRLARKPASLSFEEAAILPVSGATALQAVRRAGVEAGDRVLVIGASGGVGSYAVQVAAARGAEVTGVASGTKADLVRSLGATRVIDHTREEIDAAGGRWDVIIDVAGLRPLSLLRRCLEPDGTLVIVGGEGGDRWLGGTHRQLAALALNPFTRQRLTALMSKETAADFAELADLADRGGLRPVLERTYALGEAAKAIDHLVAGHVRGKVAVSL